MLISTKTLKSAFEKAKIFTDQRSYDPTIQCIGFKVLSDEKLSITATDLESGLYTEVEGQGNSIDRGFCVNSKHLEKVFKAKTDNVEIVSLENNWISINNSKLAIIPIEEYPCFPDTSDCKHEMLFDRKLILEYLEKTVFSIAKNEQRHTLNGLYLQFKEDSIHFTSSDGYRLSHYQVPVTTGMIEDVNIVVPKDAVVRLIKILKKSKCETLIFKIQEKIEEVERKRTLPGDIEETYIDKIITHKICVDVDDLKIVSRCITGEFPNFDAILDTENACGGQYFHVLVNKSELTNAVETVRPFCGEKTQYAKFTFDSDSLVIFGNNPNMGSASETVQILFEKNPDNEINIGMNMRYLLDAVKTIDSDELDIRIFDHENPLILVQERGLTLIMPRKLQ